MFTRNPQIIDFRREKSFIGNHGPWPKSSRIVQQIFPKILENPWKTHGKSRQNHGEKTHGVPTCSPPGWMGIHLVTSRASPFTMIQASSWRVLICQNNSLILGSELWNFIFPFFFDCFWGCHNSDQSSEVMIEKCLVCCLNTYFSCLDSNLSCSSLGTASPKKMARPSSLLAIP